MHFRHKPILTLILLFSLLALACNTVTGLLETSPTPAPASPATVVAGATSTVPAVTAVPGQPIPTITNVPPQTSTPASGSSDPGDPSLNWPPPVSGPTPFADTTATAAQQTTFDILSQAQPPERDDIELAQLYQGFVGTLPQPPLVTTPLIAGTIQQLNVLNHENNTLSPIEVELLAVSDHAYFWFDTGPGSNRPSQSQLDQTGSAFDEIYEDVISFFGSESNPGVDGDPRVHIVNASPLALCSVTIQTAGSCGLAGYFSSFDAIPTIVDAESNAREMFVMNVDFFGDSFYLNVLAHEFRHMIEDNHDRGDTDWETEGSAVLAEDLLGFQDSARQRANLFLSQPDQQLNSWTDGFTLPYYGQGYLMNCYIFDRLGPDLYHQFATSPESGLLAVDSVAAANNLSLTGEGLWLDWLVALAVHDHPQSPEQYHIQATGLNTAFSLAIADFPAVYEETVHQYAADYYELLGSENVVLNFTGSALVPLLDTPAASGESYWYSNRANYSHSRLTRAVDLTGVDQAALQYSVYHDIEYGYDYAYLFVSTDNGQSWQELVADNMQGLVPADNPSGSALTTRFYTGRSESWQQESVNLTPYAGQNILIRFAYLTDPILTFGGFAVDNIAIPEIGFYDDAETAADGWVAEGFDRVTAAMPQQWHLQLITFPGGVPAIEYLTLDDGRLLSHSLSLAGSDGRAILIVAATAPMTLELAHYRLEVVR